MNGLARVPRDRQAVRRGRVRITRVRYQGTAAWGASGITYALCCGICAYAIAIIRCFVLPAECQRTLVFELAPQCCDLRAQLRALGARIVPSLGEINVQNDETADKYRDH